VTLLKAAIRTPHSQCAAASDFKHGAGLRAGIFEASMETGGAERIVCLIGPLTIASKVDGSTSVP
jgi:hypothetical protein